MRTLAVLGSVAALGLAVAGLGTSAPSQPGLTGKCAKANLDLDLRREAHARNGQPAFPPGGAARQDTASRPRPVFGPGYSRRSPTKSPGGSGSRRAEVTWKAVPFNKSIRTGQEDVRLYISQVSY